VSVPTLVIRGELHLTLAAVADTFEVEVRWVEEVYSLGLLGPGERAAGSIAVPAKVLDRVAEILRLSRYHGVPLEAVVVLLGP
jgi:hypothetical protein